MVAELAQPRVDERVMGAGTTVRFVLLVVLLLVSSSAMMPDVISGLMGGMNDHGCTFAAGGDPSAGTLQTFRAINAQEAAYQACMARYASPLAPWWVAVAWPILTLAMASVLFFALPAWKTRRRVAPLDTTDHSGDLPRLLAELVSTAGLARTPRFVVDPTAASIGAVVFGRNRRPILCLNSGLLASRRNGDGSLRAVLLHEFAHIRNGDVTVTYATVAVWRVFLAAVLLPFAVWSVEEFSRWIRSGAGPADSPPVLTRSLLLPAVMIALVYLARSDVLRSREIYADRAAVRWGADPGCWDSTTSGQRGGALRRVLSSFIELWRTHPRWDLRRDALTDPSALFGIPALPMFLTGAAATLINAQLSSLGIYGLNGSWWWRLTVGVISAGLVTGVVGVALWRATAYSALTSRPAPNGVRVGLWLGSGMAVGELVTNRIVVFEWLPANPVVLMLGMIAGTVFAWWVAQCAQLWVRAWRSRTIYPVMLLSLAAAGLALTMWFAWWQGEGPLLAAGSPYTVAGQRQFIEQAFPGPAGDHQVMLSVIAVVLPLLTNIVDQPLAATTVAVLWLVPLLAFTIHPTAIPPQWARTAPRDTGDASGPVGETRPPLPRVLLPGLLGGVLCWAALVVVQAWMHAYPPVSGQPSILYRLIHEAWLLVALLAATAVTASAASMLARRYRLLVALITAEISALVGLVGIFALLSLDGCVSALSLFQTSCRWEPEFSWLFFEPFLTPSMVLPGLTAFVTAAVVSVFQKLRPFPTQPLTCATLPGNRVGLRRLPVVVLCIVAVAITAAGEAYVAQINTPRQDVPTRLPSLRVADDATVSPLMRAIQTADWSHVGGDELLLRFIEDYKRVGEALSDPVHNQAWVSRIRPACADLSRFTQDASSFFRVPDPQAQQLWQTFATQTGKGGADCVQALDLHNDTLLDAAATELEQAEATGELFEHRLGAVTAEGIRERGSPKPGS